MATSQMQSLSFGGLVQIIWRHKFKMLLWCAAVMSIAAAALVVLPKSYGSWAKVYLRMGRESVTLDPSATTGKTVEIQDSRENQVISTRDMALSRSLLDKVVDEIGAEEILREPAKSSAERTSQFWRLVGKLPRLSLSPEVSEREQAVTKLSKSLRVDVTRNSSVLDISFVASSPQLAQRILAAFLKEFQVQYVEANRTVGSLQFFSDQSAELKRRLESANVALRDAKNEGSMVSILAEQQAVQKQLGEVETETQKTQAAAIAAAAAIANYNQILAALPERHDLMTTNGFPNGAADNMRQELYRAQIAEWGLETKLGSEHPVVIAAREQLRRSAEILDQQPLQREQTTVGVNPVYQAIDLERRREVVKLAAMQAKATALDEQYAGLRKRVRDLNASEIRIVELDRNVELATNTYRSYVEHQEQARIAHELAASQISNIVIVQRPTLIEKPVSPRPFIVLGAGLVLAMAGSIGLALGCEYHTQAIAASKSELARNKMRRSSRGIRDLVEREELIGVS